MANEEKAGTPVDQKEFDKAQEQAELQEKTKKFMEEYTQLTIKYGLDFIAILEPKPTGIMPVRRIFQLPKKEPTVKNEK